MKRDFLLVLSAYMTFGLLPLFWGLLSHVDPTVVVLNRAVWSMVFLGMVMLVRGTLRESLKPLANLRYFCGVVLSSALLATNWGVYIVALQRGELLSASLAYYIAPLLTVLAAAVFLGERLSAVKKVAVGCLVAGVAVPVVAVGQLPVLALVIGGSWVGYTLVRRTFRVSPVQGIFHETLLLTAAALVVAPFFRETLQTSVAGFDSSTWVILVTTGPVTALPLLALVCGMRSVPMQAVGVMQYVVPTMKLLLSVAYYSVYPSSYQVAGLGLIWLGIVVFFIGESARVRRIKWLHPAPRASEVC